MKRTDNMLDAKQVLSVVEQFTVALDLLDNTKSGQNAECFIENIEKRILNEKEYSRKTTAND